MPDTNGAHRAYDDGNVNRTAGENTWLKEVVHGDQFTVNVGCSGISASS
jgi:hypothetical protein